MSPIKRKGGWLLGCVRGCFRRRGERDCFPDLRGIKRKTPNPANFVLQKFGRKKKLI